MDPIATPLLVYVLGNLARELITDACKDHLKDRLKSFFGWLEKLGERDKVEFAYQDAMEQAYGACLEMLLHNIKGLGYSNEELKQYQSSIEAFIKDDKVAEELLNAVREPGRDDLPSPDVLRERWKEIGGQELPSDTLWNAVAIAFRRQATKRIILSDDLRELLNARNLQQLRELIERQGGVKVPVRRDRYSQRMRTKFSPVDLANLMPAYADDPGRMVIRDVFVAQDVRENPPPVEIPKDLAERLRKEGRREAGADIHEDLDEKQLKKLGAAYVSQSPKPVLDVIAAADNRLLVLTGEPGSGKSTLMRYLLTGIIEPPVDRKSGEPLPWTEVFKEAFPLLIELRDFYALRRSDECDNFLDYVDCMGKNDHWFLDQHAVNDYLENGRSLVMFDGLDEIFDTADRERVMQEIAGFAQRYRHARIIVTSRPVGYKEQVLRDAGFAHFGIQDLGDAQIETFIQGWFALTFPQQPQQAEQRIERVLGSVRQSKPIRLLAGNPMLLTIMALLAREEELPRERAKFYEKAVEVLCHHWDANRNLELPEDRYLNADDKKDLLRRIATRMQAGEGGLKGNIIQEDDLEHEIQAFLIDEQWQPNEAAARKAARRMIRQLRERNYILCLRGPHLYGFVHRTFLEYLTAAEYVRRFDRQPQQMTIEELIELFDQHCREDDWREVLRLICGQIDEQFVGHIVEHLGTRTDLEKWDGETSLSELPLAIWCLSEVRSVSRLETAGRELMESSIRLIVKGRQRARQFLFNELLPAAKELGSRWPGKGNLEARALAEIGGFDRTGWSDELWPQFLAAVHPIRQLILKFAFCSEGPQEGRDVRRGAIQALAEHWADEATRRLLIERAIQDENGHTRRTALKVLAEKWADETTRKLLEERAVKDENEYPRSAALEALAEKWPDETRRKLLEERAVQDKDGSPRSAALQALAEKWPDDTTRMLLAERAAQDENSEPRRAALQALAEKWPDETTRKFLTERTVQDENVAPRCAALEALAEEWADETTRKLLAKRAVQDEHYELRRTALHALAKKWPDEALRKLLEERAVKDEDAPPRHDALHALAERWPDETTRKLLEERAVQDEHDSPRRAALRVLAEKWPDEQTRRLLAKRAGVDGVAASLVGGQHSEFGRIVYTRDLDGRAPYLDPAEPVSREHIERAAEKARVPADKIDETVRSLSAHMGWDITKGTAG